MGTSPVKIASAAAATALVACSAACTLEVGEDDGVGLEASVTAMLERSGGGWNDGDLDVFLADYSSSATTSFMTLGGPVYGPEEIRVRYAPAFAPSAPRDSLRFESVRAREVQPMIALATGRYILHDGDALTSSGWFTLVLRRVSDGWRIVHDHSSESPLPAGAGSTREAS